MPEILIVAGPNGAGKTSFANAFLRKTRDDLTFINADEIARELAAPDISPTQLDLRAGREMLERIEDSVAARASFSFETTLASLTYAHKIPTWRQSGYTVVLIYLRLPSVEISLQRVRKRVAAGGHGIPEHVVRKRFAKSQSYLETIYKPIVDEWHVWDSREHEFCPAEFWNDR
jgi:predicted ABC-type ATPase